MLESNPPDAVKRYAPPSQRNRSLNRRKSSEKFVEVNYSHGIEGEKCQGSYSRNFPAMDLADAGINNIQSETARPGLIPLNGCSISEVSQLLNDQTCTVSQKTSSPSIQWSRWSFRQPPSSWAAAWNSFNDPSVDLSERPIMYSGVSGSSWGHLKLPHQMDFLGELRRAVQSAPGNAISPAGEHS